MYLNSVSCDGEDPGLSRWAQCLHSVLLHKDAERDVTLEAGGKMQGDVRKGL